MEEIKIIEFTPLQLEIIALAEKGTTPQKIARVMGISVEEFMDEESLASKALDAGRLMIEIKLNDQKLKLALMGSGPAISDATELLEHQTMEIIKMRNG